jgi:hypothetical protein
MTHPLLVNPFLPHFQHRPQKTQKNKNMFPMCSIWLVPNLFSTCSHQVPDDASMCGEYIYIYMVIFQSKEIHYLKMQLELWLSPWRPPNPLI